MSTHYMDVRKRALHEQLESTLRQEKEVPSDARRGKPQPCWNAAREIFLATPLTNNFSFNSECSTSRTTATSIYAKADIQNESKSSRTFRTRRHGRGSKNSQHPTARFVHKFALSISASDLTLLEGDIIPQIARWFSNARWSVYR